MSEKLPLSIHPDQALLVDLSKNRVVLVGEENKVSETPPVDTRKIIKLPPFVAIKINTKEFRVVPAKEKGLLTCLYVLR